MYSSRRKGSIVSNKDDCEFIPDGGLAASTRNQWYFEIAWEVANKGNLI